ncbi:MAG TPA: NAD(P)-dependent oxidoreductase [Thermoanaerobaculia bacterium]|jgi:nucleoside-diphosphate-sugar epimerase|nr:NAD(P)-dependent oxidoreductase [Thermoanaerobaculia bacterium]
MADALDYRGRRVLVTGASGFIGRRLCRRLRELGAEVEPASRKAAPAEETRWHQVDLGDPREAARVVVETQPATAFHLASQVTESRERKFVLPTFHANLASTVYLLDALTEQGCKRIVQAGSLEEPEPGDPVSTPASPYAAAKWSAGAYARMFHQLWQTPVVLARLFMVFGPEQRDLTKLVPHVVTSLLLGRDPQLGSGKRPVDWVFVDDVVEGLLRLGLADGVEGLQVDLGSGKLVPVKAVVEQIYATMTPDKQPPFGGLQDRPMEPVRVARAEETGELLGWSPTVTLEDGLQRTIEWYRTELDAGRLAPVLSA